MIEYTLLLQFARAMDLTSGGIFSALRWTILPKLPQEDQKKIRSSCRVHASKKALYVRVNLCTLQQ